MKSKRMRTIAIATALVSALGASAIAAQDKYTLKVPGGLAFSEFKGYESWQIISLSQSDTDRGDPRQSRDDRCLPAGIPGNGKPFPDGAKMAKIHWTPKTSESSPTRRCRAPCTTSTSW